MSACPACRAPLPDGARFCPSCGERVERERPVAAERKVVTTLFADLVGFTALGERHDPEDVDAVLSDYYTLAKEIVERFGGVVEKFIGDAVVGLFGVPKVHEDDAERAVRAALEIVAHMPGLPDVGGDRLQVRAAVDTGQALVRVRARPETGEGVLVGDAVNTAARLLADTRPATIAVGAATYRLTRRAITYEPLPPLLAKGKTKPVERWLATGAVSRRGIGPGHRAEVPMIGREVELAILGGLLDKAISLQSPQSVLIVGEAGIGKSRLVRELFAAIDRRPGLMCNWRQSGCPAYGESLTYWPLRDIISAHAGIVPGDDPATAETRLGEVLPAGADKEWILTRLRPLAGLPADRGDRDDLHTAWTRYFEIIASTRPTVVVVEDLHWGSDQILDFLDYLSSHARGVPLLVIGTARPELLDRNPGGDTLLSAATRVRLKALPMPEAEHLAGLLAGVAHVASSAAEVADRCGGNPLLAEELTRYLADADGASGPEERSELPATPDSIQALIAARLDSLPAPQKETLLDAAVAGEAFGRDMVAAVSDLTAADLDRALEALEDREFLRRATEPATSPGDREFSFWHALTRDVAYRSLPRATRATKHARVADWIERDGGPLLLDRTAVLADHRLSAHDLAKAAGLDELTQQQREPAVAALLAAGDQSMSLDVEAAVARYAQAAELESPDGPQRGLVMHRLGKALTYAADFAAAVQTFEQALALLQGNSDLRPVAVAVSDYSTALCLVGDVQAAVDLHVAWLSTFEKEPPSPENLTFLNSWASLCNEIVDLESGLSAAESALAMARKLGLPEPSRPLQLKAYCACLSGDRSGLEDYERALACAHAAGDTREIGATTYNFGVCLAQFDGPAASLARRREANRLCRQRHDRAISYSLRYGIAHDLYLSGDWTAARHEIEDLEPLLEAAGNLGELGYLHCLASRLSCETAEAEQASRYADALRDLSHGRAEIGLRSLAMVAAGQLQWSQGDRRGCLRLLEECLSLPGLEKEVGFDWSLPCALRIAADAGDPTLFMAASKWIASPRPLSVVITATAEGLREELAGHFHAATLHLEKATTQWSRLGVPYEEAQARLAWARCEIRAGRNRQAGQLLRSAVASLEQLGARVALDEARRLADGLSPAGMTASS